MEGFGRTLRREIAKEDQGKAPLSITEVPMEIHTRKNKNKIQIYVNDRTYEM
jgi:hypothetical protein